MYEERFPNVCIRTSDIRKIEHKGYEDGYNIGYSWLTRGQNFKHPSIHGGYIPGGPYIFMAYKDNKPDVKEYAQLSRTYHDDWINGWIDGINQYVCDNGLNYPEVTK